MRRFSTKGKIATGVAAVILLGSAGGVAYAFWSGGGSGSGSTTAAASSGTVTYTVGFAGAALAPGTSETVTYGAYNTNSSNLQVTNPTATISADAAHSGCLASWFTVPQPTQGTTLIPAGTTAASPVAMGSGSLTFNDSATVNENACKGATLTVTVSSS